MQAALENQLHLFDMFAAIWALMKSSMFRNAALLFLIPAGAFSATNVVNLSHYDMMRPDFATMKNRGIVGVIHEATYHPSFATQEVFGQANGGAASGTALGSVSLR